MADRRVGTGPFLVPPGSTVDLRRRDPREPGDFDGGKDEGLKAV
jgi:hypothetical protein